MNPEVRKYSKHVSKVHIEVLRFNKQKGVWYWDLPACVSVCFNKNRTKKSRGYAHPPQGTRWNDVLRRLIIRKLGEIGSHSRLGTRNIIGNCSEQHAGNNFMNDYGEDDVNRLYFSEAVRPRTMEIIKPCENCQALFPTLNP